MNPRKKWEPRENCSCIANIWMDGPTNNDNSTSGINEGDKIKEEVCLLERLHQWQVKYLCICWFKYLKSFRHKTTLYAAPTTTEIATTTTWGETEKYFQNDLAFLLETSYLAYIRFSGFSAGTIASSVRQIEALIEYRRNNATKC